MKCPYCGHVIDAVGGYHAKGGPVGHAPGSFGTEGEHFLQTHQCESVNFYVAPCLDSRLVGIGLTQDVATVRIGGCWR